MMPYDHADLGNVWRVSILVVLDWTMMRDHRPRRGGSGAVSILVVLDWTMMPVVTGRRRG